MSYHKTCRPRDCQEVVMTRPTSGPPLLREINTATVLAALRGRPPLRLAEVAARTGLSRPTVGQSVDKLVAMGWAEYVGGRTEATGPGRPARLVRFRSDAGHIVGVDVGPHKILAMVADLDGKIVATGHHELHSQHTGSEVLAELQRVVFNLLERTGINPATVTSVAVGTPGTVDPKTHAVTFAPSLPGWQSLPLQHEIAGWFDCPVQVENDANLAAVAERWCGVAKHTNTVLYVHWGARIGAGVIIGGRLHRGALGGAGEIGYLTVAGGARTAEPDTTGLGPFERAVGAGAIVRLAKRGAQRESAPDMDERFDEREAERVFQAAREGDRIARRAIDTAASRLAKGLAPVLLVLDPDLVVLGGGISKAGANLLRAVERHLRRLTLVPPRLELSMLGDQATALGAVRIGLTDVEHRLLPSAPTARESALPKPPLEHGPQDGGGAGD